MTSTAITTGTAITSSTAITSTATGSAATRASTGGTPRLRITRRGRVVLGALVVLPVAALLAGLGLMNAGSAVASVEPGAELSYVTVMSGDSLWELAEAIEPEGDTRTLVDELVALNRLDGGALEAGQRIAIPARYDS
ncbi:LysM peptidoglycan-binding domain-containing protein [Homoserinibacter sp. YIM 151385]|uniref:LysM peptidoglycan-binding domain-containing protein n=1 Tax=Homoserinibacter sp. YIM 151385 TaxID=2985506 RepID=UPI0022F0B402|nr:LysM peptidoglycan-binding domain-containing protein [Homoserinibacter sp. YIM 151385]WBU38886.1 LysM peptidoglycan-binding domain-containing protein [Homoserinibacter sp. YIM 151385]